MNQQEFEKRLKSANNKLYDFYRRCIYQMQEHPWMFWALFLLAFKGLVWW